MTMVEASKDAPGDVTPRRGPLSRWLLRLGILLILAGLSVFGWIGWQLYGTNYVSHRVQHHLVDQLHQQWQVTPGQRIVQTEHGPAQAIVHIPRLGKDYEVPVIEGTSEDALASGFGHYDGTADPGKVGNYALAGHRITHGQPLADMGDLRVGDEVDIETYDTTYVYRLTSAGDALTVSSSQTWVIDKLPHNPTPGGIEPVQVPGQHLLTLTTCSELFHTDNRWVAFGILDHTEPAGTP